MHVYKDISRINHSCFPNCYSYKNPDDNYKYVYAVKDI